MNHYNDTYFFNSKRAKKIAKKRNELNEGTSKIQICFNSDEKDNKNLINVPIENFKEFFKNNSYRYPTYVDFIDSEYENDEELQSKVIKIFATIFEEINEDDIKIVENLVEKFQNFDISKDTENIRLAFIATKKHNHLFKYLKSLSKALNNRFKSKFLTEKSKSNMILDEIKTKDVLNFLLDYLPNAIVLYNEFHPQLFHKDIIYIHLVNSFSVCNKIIEYENTIDMKKNLFFTSSHYYEKVLNQKGINSYILEPIVEDIPRTFKSYENRKIDLVICDNYFDLNEYIVFLKMIKKVNKFLDNKNKLTIAKLISFIEKTTYPNNDDWELNIFMHKHIVLQNILKTIKLNKTIKIVGNNWKTFGAMNYKIEESFSNKIYKNSKYVFLISSTIINEDLLNILKFGAIPIIYDLRAEDKYYNNIFDKYCLFIDTVDNIENIINNNIKPNKKFDKVIEDRYNNKNVIKNLVKFL